jgi:hypothetical protein
MVGLKRERQKKVDPNLLKSLKVLPSTWVLDWYYTGFVIDISTKKRISLFFSLDLLRLFPYILAVLHRKLQL